MALIMAQKQTSPNESGLLWLVISSSLTLTDAITFFQPREQRCQTYGHHQVNQGDGIIRLFVNREAA